jgi:hypothetical protein
VETTEGVDAALRDTVKHERARIEEVIEYGLLTQNNEASALLIAKEETNAGILVDVVAAEIANKRVLSAERLQNSTFYLIKMVHNDTLLYAIRQTKSGWKTKRAMSARSIFFMENRLDLDNRPHFELETAIDFFIVGEDLLILDKKHFESTLRYKKSKRPVLAVCTSQEVSETIALKTRIVLRGDGGRFFDPESRRREAAAAKHREEAQDCGADDAAWRIGGAGGATAWGQRQPGVLLAQPLSPRPSGREERGQHQPAAGDGN